MFTHSHVYLCVLWSCFVLEIGSCCVVRWRLSTDSPCRPGWPGFIDHPTSFLPIAGITGVHHHSRIMHTKYCMMFKEKGKEKRWFDSTHAFILSLVLLWLQSREIPCTFCLVALKLLLSTDFVIYLFLWSSESTPERCLGEPLSDF